jgi:heat shock protein HtpX
MIWELIEANKRKTLWLVGLMALLLLALGYCLGEMFAPRVGWVGMGFGLLLWAGLTAVSYYWGDSLILHFSHARPIEPQDHPTLYNVVEEMKIASGLDCMPRIYIIDDPAPNAFATGRDPQTASVAVTSGLLQQLTRDELQGVIAHEVAHVVNRDILLMMMVSAMMGSVVILSDMMNALFRSGGTSSRRTSSRDNGGAVQAVILVVALVLMILGPIAAQLIYFAISRKREYLADACSAQFTRYPEGLASALEKIAGSAVKLASANKVMAPLYIINPLASMKLKGKDDLNSTHPPTEQRIAILRQMSGSSHLGAYETAYRSVTGRPVGVFPRGVSDRFEPVPLITPQQAAGVGGVTFLDQRTSLERYREANDLLWKTQNYHFIPCTCGTVLKVPPQYPQNQLDCPVCGKIHSWSKTGQGDAAPVAP